MRTGNKIQKLEQSISANFEILETVRRKRAETAKQRIKLTTAYELAVISPAQYLEELLKITRD